MWAYRSETARMSGLHTIFQNFTVAETEERDRERGGRERKCEREFNRQ